MTHANIPAELKELNQWVCFKLQYNDKKKKYDKIPKNPHNGYNAKSNDQSTWSDYQTAVRAADHYRLDGIGFQFANGIFGVDLDNVILDGKLSPEAQDVVETLNSYTEYSPSGNGLHILCKGAIPDKDRRKGFIEMYSEGRFFTVTGKPYGEVRPLAERTDAAKQVHEKYLSREKARENQIRKPESVLLNSTKQKPVNTRQEIDLSETEILARAISSKNGDKIRALFNGEISGYTSASEADLSLCTHLAYWTNGDARIMDSLFRKSGLYREEKWNKDHGAGTYGNMTISKALEGFIPWTKKAASHTKPATQTTNTNASAPVNSLYQTEPAAANVEEPEINVDDDLMSSYIETNFVDDVHKFSSFKNQKTGFTNIDKEIGNLYPGLYYLGAGSSTGKTTFCLQMADQIAASGQNVLYFSMEQNKMEMLTKSLARYSYQMDPKQAVKAIDIRGGKITPHIVEAAKLYQKTAQKMRVVSRIFSCNLSFMFDYIKAYMKKYEDKPVIFIDYLQIIPPLDERQIDKAKIDAIVSALKQFQSNYDLTFIVISSVNRESYFDKISFRSFKESGSIEYSGDVVWGLQPAIIVDPNYQAKKTLTEKTNMIRAASKQYPRKMLLNCIKNRYGEQHFECVFDYHPSHDYFIPTSYVSPPEFEFMKEDPKDRVVESHVMDPETKEVTRVKSGVL